MEKAFISYRRQDSAGYSRALYNELAQYFDDEQIFMDVDDIPLGTDFVQILNRNLQDCKVMLVIIGQQWLDIRGHDGKRRLDNPNDFVRLEIARALENNFNIIPVLVNGAPMPAEKDLPDILKPLSRRQALELDNKYYQHGITDLVKALEVDLGEAKKKGVTPPAPILPEPISETKKRPLLPILLGLSAVVLLGSLLYFWQQSDSTPQITETANQQNTPGATKNFTSTKQTDSNQPASAPAGFDCRKANTDVENAICNDNKTRKTDLALNQLFTKVNTQLPPQAREVLGKRQKDWLKQRDNYIRQTCFTQANQPLITHCIENYYQQRITSLARIPTNLTSRVQLTDPPTNIRKIPNGEILCQIQQKQMLTVYSGSPITYNGANWYQTQVCENDRWGVVHESQISQP
uniref:TIR domain-containing protein n=1 Tax=uncultured Thiotrichaceae bacterium TaxID=298394 RepID=A0A6S6UI14_9GAMM|nr:MAG: Unknown protein [uncultured Thiotrichaceae bacterium]